MGTANTRTKRSCISKAKNSGFLCIELLEFKFKLRDPPLKA